MVNIKSIRADDSAGCAAVQALFREYGEFLRATGTCGYFDCGGFDHAKFAAEIDRLPADYADHEGELLLATVGAEPAGCIAYRCSSHAGSENCEIKRLYVAPTFRSKGIARRLVAEALARASNKGFRRAILDTDMENMPGASDLYQSFGFKLYGQQKGSIACFDRLLP